MFQSLNKLTLHRSGHQVFKKRETQQESASRERNFLQKIPSFVVYCMFHDYFVFLLATKTASRMR